MATSKSQKAPGVAGLLGKAAKSPAKSDKSSTPITTVTPALSPALLSFVEAARAAKLAEANKQEAAQALIGFARDERVRLSREAGSAYSSIKLKTPKGDAQATFVSQARCKQMPVEEFDNEIRSVFGGKYDDYFRVSPRISIKDEITDDQATKLVEVLESAGLMGLIQVSPLVVPNDRFFQDVVLDTEVEAKARKLQSDGALQITDYLRA